MNKRWNTNRERPELLLPAKDLEVLRTAVHFGADAVYIGGEAFSLRAKARNFSPDDMREGIRFAHERGVQVHVAANIFAHNNDIKGAASYFGFLQEIGPDAVLIADPGMFSLAKKHCPDIPIHISTQANNTNYETFRFWHSLGAARVVCARELSLGEIAQIRENTPKELEIEAFIHGAMCISYSGRCLLSSWFTGRDANRGACTHPCRWKYTLMEEDGSGEYRPAEDGRKGAVAEEDGSGEYRPAEDGRKYALMEESRPGEYLPIEEDRRGTYIMNSRDLCMIEHLPELAQAGVDSLKIEGRMKTALYVASITRAYRRAIDDYLAGGEKYAANMDWYRQEIRKCTYRDFTTGFYFGRPDADSMVYTDNTYASDAVFLGIVEEAPAEGSFPGRSIVKDGPGKTALPGRSIVKDRPGETASPGRSIIKDGTGEAAFPGESPAAAGAPFPVTIHQKNKFCTGDMIEVMRPDGNDEKTRVLKIWNAEGKEVPSAPHPGELLYLQLEVPAAPGDILRSYVTSTMQ